MVRTAIWLQSLLLAAATGASAAHVHPLPQPVPRQPPPPAHLDAMHVKRDGLMVSTDGSCGEHTTCKGSIFGTCCSQDGNCGSNLASCGTGCQPSFGLCDAQHRHLNRPRRPRRRVAAIASVSLDSTATNMPAVPTTTKGGDLEARTALARSSHKDDDGSSGIPMYTSGTIVLVPSSDFPQTKTSKTHKTHWTAPTASESSLPTNLAAIDRLMAASLPKAGAGLQAGAGGSNFKAAAVASSQTTATDESSTTKKASTTVPIAEDKKCHHHSTTVTVTYSGIISSPLAGSAKSVPTAGLAAGVERKKCHTSTVTVTPGLISSGISAPARITSSRTTSSSTTTSFSSSSKTKGAQLAARSAGGESKWESGDRTAEGRLVTPPVFF